MQFSKALLTLLASATTVGAFAPARECLFRRRRCCRDSVIYSSFDFRR